MLNLNWSILQKKFSLFSYRSCFTAPFMLKKEQPTMQPRNDIFHGMLRTTSNTNTYVVTFINRAVSYTIFWRGEQGELLVLTKQITSFIQALKYEHSVMNLQGETLRMIIILSRKWLVEKIESRTYNRKKTTKRERRYALHGTWRAEKEAIEYCECYHRACGPFLEK